MEPVEGCVRKRTRGLSDSYYKWVTLNYHKAETQPDLEESHSARRDKVGVSGAKSNRELPDPKEMRKVRI